MLRLREVARARLRDKLIGRPLSDVDDVLTAEPTSVEALPGLVLHTMYCDLGVMDIVFLGVLVGLAAKTPGVTAAAGCLVSALVAAMFVSLHSIAERRPVPALPVALGLTASLYVLLRVLSLNECIGSLVERGLYL